MGKKRKESAFEKEALREIDALYGMALRLTRNAKDAEDLVQDTLVKAFRFQKRYQEDTNMKAWLFKILTRTFYNSVRKAKNIRKLQTDAEEGWHYERFISSASASGKSSEELFLDTLSSEKLKAAIEELPEDFQIVIVLCDVHGFSYKEIADIVDCPVGTVMSRLYRARRLLQRSLYDYALDLGLVSESDQNDKTADLDHYRLQKRRAESK